MLRTAPGRDPNGRPILWSLRTRPDPRQKGTFKFSFLEKQNCFASWQCRPELVKLALIAFFVAWLLLLFSVMQHFTDVYEISPLAEIVPFYIASIACFCVFFATWRGNLARLAIISAFYQASIVVLPFLKDAFLYGTEYDNMHHFALAQTMLATGHVPPGDPYFGFTGFHGTVVFLSIITGLPLNITFRLVLGILPALIQIAVFWIATRIVRSYKTQKLAIFSGMIAFAITNAAAAPLTAWFLTVLILALIMQFAVPGSETSTSGLGISLVFLGIGLVLTHHQTSFFAMFDFIGVGLLAGLLRDPLRVSGVAAQRLVVLGTLILGVSYLWWTYYAGFSDTLRFVASIVSEETVSLPQTFAGRGFFYYGPVTWAVRTLFLYPQRGQVFVWTGLGFLATVLLILGRVKRIGIAFEAQGLSFLHSSLFLGLWTVFLFVPFFVIGGARFLQFAFLLAPPFMAIGMESFYSFLQRSKILSRVGIRRVLKRMEWRPLAFFILLVLVFVEFSAPFVITGFSAAGSVYQHGQLSFINAHYTPADTILIHDALAAQFAPFAPNVNGSRVSVGVVPMLYALATTGVTPSYAQGSLVLLQKLGPAGAYFEPVNFYSNDSWVPSAVNLAVDNSRTSVIYNSGEAFIIITWES